MTSNLIRNSILALGIFVVVAVLVYTNMEFAAPITEYVSYVVTTDFSIQPIIQRTGVAEGWETWNLDSLLQAWSKVSFGW